MPAAEARLRMSQRAVPLTSGSALKTEVAARSSTTSPGIWSGFDTLTRSAVTVATGPTASTIC
jgi:hypothetical protein